MVPKKAYSSRRSFTNSYLYMSYDLANNLAAASPSALDIIKRRVNKYFVPFLIFRVFTFSQALYRDI